MERDCDHLTLMCKIYYFSVVEIRKTQKKVFKLIGWLCFTSHWQRGHLEMARPYTVPCEGRETQFLHRSHRAVAWQSITLPLCHASSCSSWVSHTTKQYKISMRTNLLCEHVISLKRMNNALCKKSQISISDHTTISELVDVKSRR